MAKKSKTVVDLKEFYYPLYLEHHMDDEESVRQHDGYSQAEEYYIKTNIRTITELGYFCNEIAKLSDDSETIINATNMAHLLLHTRPKKRKE